MERKYTRKLILENGEEFLGYGFGGDSERVCEIVFNTSMCGYQEIVSDLTYTDQAVVMTYPLIGNYGITDEDFEAKTATIGALIVSEYNDLPSNFRSTKTLSEVLEEYNIPGIEVEDTRALTKMIRNAKGGMRCLITGNTDMELDDALNIIKNAPVPQDQAERVSCRKRWFSRTPDHKHTVVAIDCGIKLNIIRILNRLGCNVTVVPFSSTAEEILSMRPDGILISNGPGDPKDAAALIPTINGLKGKKPIFGIGLGHQLICLSYGADTYKMDCGHRGGYPVRIISTGKIDITAQNYGYIVDRRSIDSTALTVTHENIMDKSCVGVECKEDKVISVQFSPESAPGPQDSEKLFAQFVSMIEEDKKNA